MPVRMTIMFRKKLEYIARCAGFHAGMLHILDQQKGNKTLYYLEVYSVYKPVWYKTGYAIMATDIEPHTCYSLGSYPNYWSLGSQGLCHAHDLMAPPNWIMQDPPHLPTVSWATAYKDDRADMEFFIGKQLTDAWFWQREALERRKKFHQDCLARNYPKKVRGPKMKAKGPVPDLIYPGGPIILPTPSPSPGMPGEKTIKLTLVFTAQARIPYDALSAIISIE